MKLLYTVPAAAGHLRQPEMARRPTCGRQVARLQPGDGKIAELIGAQPVIRAGPSCRRRWQRGIVIESYMSSGATGYDTKTYEHIKNWYDTQAWLPKNAIIINKAAFDALDKAAGRRAQGRRRRRKRGAGSSAPGEERLVHRGARLKNGHEHRPAAGPAGPT